MTLSPYAGSVPLFTQMLGGLDNVLGKAQAHATEKKIRAGRADAGALVSGHVSLSKQVQIACDFARGVTAAPRRRRGGRSTKIRNRASMNCAH